MWQDDKADHSKHRINQGFDPWQTLRVVCRVPVCESLHVYKALNVNKLYLMDQEKNERTHLC